MGPQVEPAESDQAGGGEAGSAWPPGCRRSAITVAVQKAAKVCPLGKLLDVGSRTGT